MPALHCISSFAGTSYKKFQDTAISSFISCCFSTSTFKSGNIISYIFLKIHSTLSKKIFSSQILLF